MRLLLVVLACVYLVALSSCEKGQNNSELIIAHRECIAAGTRSVMLHEVSGGYRIQCRPQIDGVDDE